MALVVYLARRVVAIALGLALTGYSAWSSWSHFHDWLGPLAAASAAVLLALSEYALRDRQRLRAGVLGILGLTAAVISGSVVLERVSSTQEARQQGVRSGNLAKARAEQALEETRQALAKAEAAAGAECSSGRGPRCAALEQREQAARQRVAEARAKLVGLGARTVENPAAQTIASLGLSADKYQLLTRLGLPLWLEIAAPVVLAYGFAPVPRKELEQPKRKRRKVRRNPRKPPAPAQKRRATTPQLRLVAANEN